MRAPAFDEADRQSLVQLQQFDGVDARLAADLVRVGVRSAGQLGYESPVILYGQIMKLRGRAEPALLDIIAFAVHAARGH